MQHSYDEGKSANAQGSSHLDSPSETNLHIHDSDSQSYSYVYAVGRIGPRFPSLSVEKEFAQAAGRLEATNLTDRQVLHSVLSDPSNRYLVRRMCWVLTIEGLETYVLQPRESIDF